MPTDKPYDLKDADIILRTPLSNGFRVHRAVLSSVSSVLETLTENVQEPDDLDGATLPEVDVDKAPEDLDLLIRLVYPNIIPSKFEDFNTLEKAFAILKEYKIEGVQELLKPILVSQRFLSSDPIRVYAIACRFGFKEELMVAAPLAAAKDFTADIRGEDLRSMSAVDYHRLVSLYKERLKKSKSDIFATPLPCSDCPTAFYEKFRQMLAERLFKEEGGKFYDIMECLEICFIISKQCGTSSSCSGSGGEVHLEKFILALVKELQKPSIPVY